MDLTNLINSVDIVDYIGQYVEFEQKGSELWCCSPLRPENTPSFSVRPETQRFYCFSTGIGGSILTFIEYYHHVTKGQAVQILKHYAGVSDDDKNEVKFAEKMSATKVCKAFSVKKQPQKNSFTQSLPDNYMERYENNPQKLQIWRDEGISDEAMQFFGVKYDSFSNCIVYPIRNADGKLVNVGARTLDPDFKAKGIRKYSYFKAWGGQMAIVYGLYENREAISAKHEVILFEGMKSVLLARGYGYKNAGAILTSHLNPGQMKILARLGANVVFALDEEIDVRADRNIQKLKQYVNVSYLYDFHHLLQAKDAPVDRGETVFSKLYCECKYKL